MPPCCGGRCALIAQCAAPPPTRARAGLLANSGCFVSNCNCVLWCFVGVLRVFCDVLRVFCGVLRVFCSMSTKHTKHLKNIEMKHWKTHNTPVFCGSLLRAKHFDCIAQNTFHKTSAKHCTTLQNTSQKTRSVKLRRKTLQNVRKTLENVTKRSQYRRTTYCAHSVFSPKIR